MKTFLLSFLALAASVPSATFASDFRFCEMEGEVQKAALSTGKNARVFDLIVLVSLSEVEKGERGKMGYTDCSEYVGESVEIRLQVPDKHGEPTQGDFVAFNYSAIDGFDDRGKFVGASISAVLHSYRKQVSTGER